MSLPFPLRIGTRGSPLALAQAHEARDRLRAAHDLPEAAIALHVIRTSGDAITDRPLSEVGGKGLFTKELDAALMAGALGWQSGLAWHLGLNVASVGYAPRSHYTSHPVAYFSRSGTHWSITLLNTPAALASRCAPLNGLTS